MKKMIVDNELLKMSKGGEKMGDTFTMNKSSNGKNVTECHKMDDSEMMGMVMMLKVVQVIIVI